MDTSAAEVTQEEGHSSVLRLPSTVLTLISIAKRSSHPFPSSTVTSNFVYPRIINRSPLGHTFFFFFFFHLTYSRWAPLPSCLRSLRIFPSLSGSRLTIFYRDASSTLLQLVNQWLNFTYSRITLSATDARVKILLDKNRAHDFRTTSRCLIFCRLIEFSHKLMPKIQPVVKR